MVTTIVVRITPAERASAAEDLNRDDGNDQLHHKKRDDDSDDGEGDYKNDAKNYGEKICVTKAADGGFCDDHSRNDVSSHCKPSDDTIKDEGTAVNIRRHNNTSNKRPLLLEEDVDDDGKKKRRRKRQKVIDLAGIPPQPPIKSNRSDGSSKYQGVTFNKIMNNWLARISVDGKTHDIGRYDKAAIDYARAAYKYKAGIAGGEGKQKIIDLAGIPPQSPIMSKRSDGSSKYHGVSFDKTHNNWRAQISVDGKRYKIGSYVNEEEAAIDYARAAYKYKAGIAGGKRKQKFIDLTDVPPQSPIKSTRNDGSSKYQGVYFDEQAKKWQARISVDGKTHFIGSYVNEEKAAIDYARAAYKYNAGIAGGKRKQKFIDLTDVPPQSPIKSKRRDCSSKYEGVTFNKTMNKWWAQIRIDGKQYKIGSYDNEEEAAIDYARAAYKYKAGQKFIDLTDVPPQSPIKSKRSGSSSKYYGVTFNKTLNKWRARISVDGKTHYIGRYDNEEEAAIDYARAAYKYKAGITTSRASLLATGSVAIPRSAGRLSFPFATVGVSSTGVERLAMKEAEIKSATDEVVAAAMAALHRHRGDAEETHNTVDYGSDAPSDLKRHDTTPSSSQLDVMTEAFLERSIARTLQSRRESGLVGSNVSMTAFLARIGSCDNQAVMADMGAKVDAKAKALLEDEQERRASLQGRGGQAEHDVSKQCL